MKRSDHMRVAVVILDVMSAKDIREDDVLDAVCGWFDSIGRPCKVVSRPDRENRTDGLTVDALVALGDPAVLWAVDVCTLSLDPGREGAVNSVERALRDTLRPLLERRGLKATAAYDVATGGAKSTRRFAADVGRRVADAIGRGESNSYGPDFTHVIIQAAAIGENEPLRLMPWNAATSDLLAELRAHAAPVIERKLVGQLRRAKDLKYPTMLVLDRVGPSGMRLGANWLVSTDGICTMIDESRSAHPNVLDSVLVIDGGSVIRLV